MRAGLILSSNKLARDLSSIGAKREQRRRNWVEWCVLLYEITFSHLSSISMYRVAVAQLFTIPKIHVLRLNWPKIEQFEKTAFVCLFVCVCVRVRVCVLANKCDGHLSILIKFINTWKIFCSSLTSLININR